VSSTTVVALVLRFLTGFFITVAAFHTSLWVLLLLPVVIASQVASYAEGLERR